MVTGGGLLLSGSQQGEAAKSIHGEHGHAGIDAQRFEVAANQGGGRRTILYEHDFGGATAQGLNADGAGSREKVDESRAGYIGRQHVEERFA